jgi:hypothetical protein
MSSKINPIDIIEGHIKTLYDNSTGDRSYWDIFFFFVLPLIVSWILVINFQLYLVEQTANTMILCLSIFTPLLFNLILIVYTMTQKEVDKHDQSNYVGDFNLRMRRLEEINSNVGFCVLISLTTILFLLVYTLTFSKDITLYKMVFNIIMFYLAGLTLLTLLMVLNRINFLISNLFED